MGRANKCRLMSHKYDLFTFCSKDEPYCTTKQNKTPVNW